MELNTRHRQRIELAVAAANASRSVTFRVDDPRHEYDGARLVWDAPVNGIQTVPSVIARGTRRQMDALLYEVQADFARQCAERVAVA